MSLWICLRSVEDIDRELSMYKSGGSYKIKYKNGKQSTQLKNNITDEEYANYLFNMYAKDLHMEENLIEEDYIKIPLDFAKEIYGELVCLRKNKESYYDDYVLRTNDCEQDREDQMRVFKSSIQHTTKVYRRLDEFINER